MKQKVFLINLLIILPSTKTFLPMYKANRITHMQATKTVLITHIRNMYHHLTYKTPEGVIIAEHWDGTETRTYPDGKIIHTHIDTNYTTKKNRDLQSSNSIESFKKILMHKK